MSPRSPLLEILVVITWCAISLLRGGCRWCLGSKSGCCRRIHAGSDIICGGRGSCRRGRGGLWKTGLKTCTRRCKEVPKLNSSLLVGCPSSSLQIGGLLGLSLWRRTAGFLYCPASPRYIHTQVRLLTWVCKQASEGGNLSTPAQPLGRWPPEGRPQTSEPEWGGGTALRLCPKTKKIGLG